MEKVISIKQLQYERLYKDFYKNPNNKNMQLHIWFKGDTVNKTKIG
jgi:hypothetical protein